MISGAVLRPVGATSTGDVIRRLVEVAVGQPVGEVVEQVVEFLAQVVAGDGVTDGQAHRRQLAGEELGIGLGLRGAGAILLERDLVAVLLTVLREQDQRRAYAAWVEKARLSRMNG